MRRSFAGSRNSRRVTTSSSSAAAATGSPTAYYLASDHGISNVAVLDKGYLAGGNTARNTTIIRSNYLTPEGVRLLRGIGRAVPRALSEELDYQHHVFRARPLHARPHRRRDAHRALARRGEQASRRRFRADRSRRDPAASARRSTCREDVRYPDPRRALSSARRASRATMRSPGATPRARWRAASRSTPGTEVTGISSKQGDRAIGVETDRGHHPRRQGPAGRRRVIEPRVGAGGLPPADPHHPAAGLRLRAAEAVPRPDRRLRLAARLHLADARAASW